MVQNINKQIFQILFNGGWATDFGTHFHGVEEGNIVRLPFLQVADNCVYELDGGPRKIPGATALNSTAITEGGTAQEILGLYEYIRHGTSGIPVRKRICHAGTVIYKEDVDGVWDSLFTGLESGKVPHYMTFDDFLIIASNSTVDVPKSWDQTTAQDLAGSPVNFSFSVQHKNRLWYSGNVAFPSRIYYTALLDPEDHAGGGSIDIDPNDGDEVTGLFTHKNDLWVLKGPNKGSIHRITGSAPTGADAFARIPFISGVGGINNNSVFKFGDDVGFMGIDGQAHSLAATAAFGDFNQAFLSAPIASWIRQNFKLSRLEYTWAVSYPERGIALMNPTLKGNTQSDRVLMMDYRFSPPRWAYWSVASVGSMAIIQDTDGIRKPFFGRYNGVALIGEQATLNWNTAAIQYEVDTPFMSFGTPDYIKTLANARLDFRPKGNFDVTLNIKRDNAALQSYTVTQSGGDVLGTATANQFTLGTSTLSDGNFSSRYAANVSGHFRAVQYRLSQDNSNEDADVHGLGAHVIMGPLGTETT